MKINEYHLGGLMVFIMVGISYIIHLIFPESWKFGPSLIGMIIGWGLVTILTTKW